MELYTLKKPNSVKTRKRKGRGPASGDGKTAGRGMNGQLSRSGSGKRAWFEGGQMPLQRRVPKRGFNNYTQKKYQIINLDILEKIGQDAVTPEVLKEKGLIAQSTGLVKVLGKGDLTKAVKVTADAFSNSSIEKIKKAGGDVIIRERISRKKVNNG